MVSRAGSNLARVIKNIKKSDFVVTNRVDEWLINNPDLLMTQDDSDMIARLLVARGSRVGVWTGSQAGKCERAQVFNFIGLPKLRHIDTRLQNLFHDGTWRHIRWQMMLKKAIPGFLPELPTSNTPDKFLGAIDGAHFDESWGFELKGTSNFTKVVSQGVFDEHLEQATRYWLSCDADPNFPELKRWVFVYEDKRSQEWREIVVERSMKVERQVQRELKRLNDATKNHTLPPVLPGCLKGTGYVFRQCAFSDKCRAIRTWEEATGEVARSSKTGRPATAAGEQSVPVVVGKRRKLDGHRS